MKVLRTDDVLDRLGVSRTTLHRWRQEGRFPEPKQLGPRSVGWTEAQLEEWWESRPAARAAAGGDGE